MRNFCLNGLIVTCFVVLCLNVPSDFQFIFHPGFGNCYRFNGGYNASGTPISYQQTFFPGYLTGITFELYAGLTDAQNYAGASIFKAFNVLVLNQTTYPYWYGQTPYTVTPTFGYDFAIARTFYEQYNAWPFAYSECLVDEHNELMNSLSGSSELFEQVVATGYEYSRDVCSEFCYVHYLAAECNCSTYRSRYHAGELDYCLSDEENACEAKFRFSKFLLFEFFNTNCLSKCPLECHKTTFQIAVSSYDYPGSSSNAQTSLAQSPTLVSRRGAQRDFVHNNESNVIKVRFFYETLAYTQVDEEPRITVDTLIGTIGGHLHLFMGMSLLSFVEIFLLCMRFINVNIFYGIVGARQSTTKKP